MKSQTSWFSAGSLSEFTKLSLNPGQYYFRMARPMSDHPNDSAGTYPGSHIDHETIAISISQLLALTAQLQIICQTVHPHVSTFDTYGNSIRNFLILACTEVEAQWSGILRANNYKIKKPTTNDYVKLADTMRLSDYEVRFPTFPWLTSIRPFENWSLQGKPTADIPWYDSYNAVKHNREENFFRGTLKHAFEAIAACYVMLVAQFGSSFRGPYHPADLTFFDLASRPAWPLADIYHGPDLYPLRGSPNEAWSPLEFQFQIQ